MAAIDRSNRPITRQTVSPNAIVPRIEIWFMMLSRLSTVGNTSERATENTISSAARESSVP